MKTDLNKLIVPNDIFYENFEPDISNENLVYNPIEEKLYKIEYFSNDYVVLSKLSIQELLEIRTKKLLEKRKASKFANLAKQRNSMYLWERVLKNSIKKAIKYSVSSKF